MTSSPARDVSADVIVIAVGEGPDGLVLAEGSADVDAALGGTLAETLTALGATGKADEVTRTLSGGKLAARLIAAVGIGQQANGADGAATERHLEALRRGAGAAVRALASAKVTRIALALPASDAVSAEAVALGALLGSYYFGRYRGNGQPVPHLTVVAAGDHVAGAVNRAQVIGEAVTLVRDLVNTSPAHLYPETLAAEADKIAGKAGLGIEILDEAALQAGGYGGSCRRGQGSGGPPPPVPPGYTPPATTHDGGLA